MIRILFGLISVLGLLMALGTVVARNLVHAALFLVAFFFLIACQFILLEAEFMAAIQVLVYIGAVAILLMFGIMLTRNIRGDETTGGTLIRKLPAVVAGLGVLAVLLVGIWDEKGLANYRPAWTSVDVRPQVNARPEIHRQAAIGNMGKAVGDEMMTRYALAFEVAGLLLTAALVGAVALAREEGPDEAPRRGAIRMARSSATSEPPLNGHGATAPLAEALTTPRA